MNGLRKATKIVSFIYFFLLPTAMLICLVMSLVLYADAQDEQFIQQFVQNYTYVENGNTYVITEDAAAVAIVTYATCFLVSFLVLIPGLIFDILIYRMTLHPEKNYSRGVWIRNGVLAIVFGAEVPGVLSIVYGAVFGGRQANGNSVPPYGNTSTHRTNQHDNDYWNYRDRDEVDPNDEEVVDTPKDNDRPKPSDYDAPDHPSDN